MKLTLRSPFDLSPRPVRELLGVQDVLGGVVELKTGSYAAGLKIGSVNWDLMTPAEQEVVEAGLCRLVAFIRFPVQIVVSKRNLDLGSTIQAIRERAGLLGEKSRMYALALAQSPESLVKVRQVWVIRRYAVVRYNAQPGEDRDSALSELQRRVAIVQGVLRSSVRVEARVLSTPELLDVADAILEKERALTDTMANAERNWYTFPVVVKAAPGAEVTGR